MLLTLDIKMLYNASRLMWQSGDEQSGRTPQSSVWSCRVVSESFDQIVQSLAAAHAKSQDHRVLCGVFAFGSDRQGALADGPVWAAPNKHRALYTPKITRQACQRGTWVDAVKRVVDQHCIGWNRCLMGLLEGSIKWPYRAGMVGLPPLGDYCLETR